MSLKNLVKAINKSKKAQKPEQKFLLDLETTMEKLDNRRKPSQWFKPSSMGGCLRNIFYQVEGMELDKGKLADSKLISMGETGSDRHERLQTWVSRMKEAGYDCEWIDVADYIETRKPEGTQVVERQGMETKCFNDLYEMSFLCDGIIRYQRKYYILEIKTEASFKYRGHEEPFEEHKYQATCYSLCFDINNVMFLYEERDFLNRKCYIHTVSQEEKDKVIEIIDYINDCRIEMKLPPKTDKDKHCLYCNYKQACKRAGNT